MTWLTAAEASDRLGVKPATLYAYVSRGVLSRRRTPGGQSLFDPDEVERLARRGRPRRRPGPSEVVIESGITLLGEDRQFYRGHDALELARTESFESVAELLWTGARPDAEPAAWRASDEALAAGRAAQTGLPGDVLPLERLQVVVPALAAADPLRSNLEPDAVREVARGLIAGMVDSLPGRSVDGDLAERLWARLAPPNAPSRLIPVLRAALVLVADHELAASTTAARVAASVRADPYAVVMTGLGASSGALHGGASLGAEALLAEAYGDPNRARAAVGLRIRRGERVPGFGHTVYRGADGRASTLFALLRESGQQLHVADAVIAEAARRRLPAPNVDLALATLTTAVHMPIGAGEAIFGIARTAGWIAHAMEEYANRSPIRLRAVYIGQS